MSNRRDGAIALRSAEAGLEKTGPLESVHFRAEYGGRLVALSGTAGLDGCQSARNFDPVSACNNDPAF